MATSSNGMHEYAPLEKEPTEPPARNCCIRPSTTSNDTPREELILSPRAGSTEVSVSETVEEDSLWKRIKSHSDQIMNIVIFANVVQMGAEEQWRERDYHQLKVVYDTSEIIFNILYVTEVIMGIIDEGFRYFCDAWHIMDVIITAGGVSSVVVMLTAGSEEENALQMVRIVRMVRLVRLLRILRLMKSRPELVMVVSGLARSIKSLFWVLLLLCVCNFVFAVFFTATVDNGIFDMPYFYDTAHASLTLIDIAILAEWGDIVRPVMDDQVALLPFFFVFLLITSFGMLNVMIGVIVESTAEAKLDIELENRAVKIAKAEATWKHKIHAERLSNLDLQNCATEEERHQKMVRRKEATYEILQELLDDPKGIPFPHGLNTQDIYDLLDFDAGGDLSLDEFKGGLERLLFGDAFQLACLTLTVIAKLRRERAMAEKHDTDRFNKIMRHMEEVALGQASQQFPDAGNAKSSGQIPAPSALPQDPPMAKDQGQPVPDLKPMRATLQQLLDTVKNLPQSQSTTAPDLKPMQQILQKLESGIDKLDNNQVLARVDRVNERVDLMEANVQKLLVSHDKSMQVFAKLFDDVSQKLVGLTTAVDTLQSRQAPVSPSSPARSSYGLGRT